MQMKKIENGIPLFSCIHRYPEADNKLNETQNEKKELFLGSLLFHLSLDL